MNLKKSLALIFSSGLIATFSWLGIKSKILISLIAPYLIESSMKVNSSEGSLEIYSLAAVAVFVGMFASNIYISISQRVEFMTKTVNRNLASDSIHNVARQNKA